MISHLYYHWKWADTYFGGRNIDIFEGGEHIATVFTEEGAKRIITVLRHSNQRSERDGVLNSFKKLSDCIKKHWGHRHEAPVYQYNKLVKTLDEFEVELQQGKPSEQVPDCPYHKYQCAWDGKPEKHYCKRDEKVILTMKEERKDERGKVLEIAQVKILEDFRMLSFNATSQHMEAISLYHAQEIVKQRLGEFVRGKQ